MAHTIDSRAQPKIELANRRSLRSLLLGNHRLFAALLVGERDGRRQRARILRERAHLAVAEAVLREEPHVSVRDVALRDLERRDRYVSVV